MTTKFAAINGRVYEGELGPVWLNGTRGDFYVCGKSVGGIYVSQVFDSRAEADVLAEAQQREYQEQKNSRAKQSRRRNRNRTKISISEAMAAADAVDVDFSDVGVCDE